MTQTDNLNENKLLRLLQVAASGSKKSTSNGAEVEKVTTVSKFKRKLDANDPAGSKKPKLFKRKKYTSLSDSTSQENVSKICPNSASPSKFDKCPPALNALNNFNNQPRKVKHKVKVQSLIENGSSHMTPQFPVKKNVNGNQNNSLNCSIVINEKFSNTNPKCNNNEIKLSDNFENGVNNEILNDDSGIAVNSSTKKKKKKRKKLKQKSIDIKSTIEDHNFESKEDYLNFVNLMKKAHAGEIKVQSSAEIKRMVLQKRKERNKTFMREAEAPQKRIISQQNVTVDSTVKQAEIKQTRQNLPISCGRSNLIRNIRKHDSVIIIGETASGKSTQLPQYLHEDNVRRNGIIGVTQPRQIAAITLAERVAIESNTEVGKQVGYAVRFQDKTGPFTKIKFLTDGILLREAISDHLLQNYSIIILDEAHERTIFTDVLFGIVKHAQSLRKTRQMPPLKVIVMSATMNVDNFSRYFNNAPVFAVSGRRFNVEMMYTKTEQEDYVHSALVTVFQIHQTNSEGDILVFCTGQEEIETMVRTARQTARSLPFDCSPLVVYPLYAALPSSQQVEVFKPPPKGSRKVIFATNIAETSITIPGIKYVVDTGMVKARTYHPGSCVDLLKVQRISKAQAWQRSGRAGRETNGICYALYTKKEYSNFKLHTIPEIQRGNLSSVILQMMAIGIKNVAHFDFIEKPSKEAITSALNQLELLGAVEEVKNKHKLTEEGKIMARFPIDPRLAKILLASRQFECTEEILSIISMLSVESVFILPSDQRELAAETKLKFHTTEGDHVMLLDVFRSYRKIHGASDKQDWCKENYLHERNLKTAMKIRKQLYKLCQDTGIPLKSSGKNLEIINKCITFGLFMNVAEAQDDDFRVLDTKQKVSIHPSSCLFRQKHSHIIYTELVQTSKCYMRNVSKIDPRWLLEVNSNLK